MAITKISIPAFLEWRKTIPVFDVRSPGEYEQAHVPGAYSFALFSDEERKEIGTAYKQVSRETAVEIGLGFFKEKMMPLIEKAKSLKGQNDNKIMVHCWRGGMRSTAVAWLLDLYGFEVYVLDGGYKSFRRWALSILEIKYSCNVLGGYTGSGKTEILQQFIQKNHAVINLEGLANHQGSAFGNLHNIPQPRQEMFENLLADALWNTQQSAHKVFWIEDESRRIGSLNIPAALYESMRAATIYFMDIPFEERLKYILNNYGQYTHEQLQDAILRIQKRLGGLETKMAIEYLHKGDLEKCFSILLRYYDRCYLKNLPNRENISAQLHTIQSFTTDASLNASLLENTIQKKEQDDNRRK
ncbi:MAG: tRNA 2-selenouridine(34) synthase MnmH [Bacteroidetes bacterium]|nr:tRNA 2-selenouridine(34) synthase MnmH [Bacteroidota bacterium]